MNQELCHDHSGCVARIDALEREDKEHMTELKRLNCKFNGIMTRINVILGCLVVACVMLVINLVAKI